MTFTFSELARRLEGVRHNHRVHITRDRLVVDVGIADVLVDGEDFPFEGVALGRGAAAVIAGGGENQHGAQGKRRETV